MCVFLAELRILDVVWNDVKQSNLIGSIFQNYYVPPIVFAVYKDDEGEEVRCCVDGKQRLTSIQKFFDGQVSTHRLVVAYISSSLWSVAQA